MPRGSAVDANYAATVSAVPFFPFLNSDKITDGLIEELPDYVAAAQDVMVTTEEKKVKWWCQLWSVFHVGAGSNCVAFLCCCGI